MTIWIVFGIIVSEGGMSNYYKDADDTKAEGTNDIGEPENCLYYIVILILLKICCLYFFKNI